MQILSEVSRTLGEYLLLPNLTAADCVPARVDLSVPVVRHRPEEDPAIRLAVPLTSAIMGAVSSPRLAIALAQCGGLSFLHHNQPPAAQAEMVAAVKRHKAGFRHSDINTTPAATLGEVTALLNAAERDTAVVTGDGTGRGVFLGSSPPVTSTPAATTCPTRSAPACGTPQTWSPPCRRSRCPRRTP